MLIIRFSLHSENGLYADIPRNQRHGWLISTGTRSGAGNGNLPHYTKKANGDESNHMLKRLSDIYYTEYCQIKGSVNPFDMEDKQYFEKRETQHMLETLKGRKSLLYLWNKQNRKCPICGKPIERTLSWNVTEKITDGKIKRNLVHNSCYKRNKKLKELEV